MGKFTKDIVSLVKNEKKNYEDASQEIRNKIKKARQNYASEFSNPKTTTGRIKTFIPMTRWEVDTITPKIFVNEKAVTVLPENEPSFRPAFIADKVLKYQIKQTRFSTEFRNSMYDLGIDGTNVWATFWNFEREVIDPKGLSNKVKKFFGKGPKPKVNVLTDKIGFRKLDLLDCYIDPIADSIQDAQSFIYRHTLPLEQVKRNRLYQNTGDVKGFKSNVTDTYDSRSTRIWDIGKETMEHEQPMVEVFERWGRFPLMWLTNKKKDEGVMIDGVITVADMTTGKPVLLRIDKNPFDHGMKPFEECWFQKKQGRWYGIGIGEKLIELQSYLNKTVNRQIENEDVLHAGLFKKKRGSGVSAKSIVSVPGGIIEVDSMDDLEQLQIRDISQLGDTTNNRIQSFVERINGASEVAVGSSADRSATTSLIKDRNADTRFAAVRGYVNDFLMRFFKQWLALDRQFIDKKVVVRITGEDAELAEIDDVLGVPEEQRSKLPPFRFIEADPETIKGDYDIEVDIDQSIPMNKAENAERILNAINLGAQLGLQRDYEKLFDAYLDNIGLQGTKFKARTPQLPLGQQQGQTPGVQAPSELGQFQNANIPSQVTNVVQ